MKLWKERLFKVLKVEVRNLKNQRMRRELATLAGDKTASCHSQEKRRLPAMCQV
jgi:hypothetical protein